MSRNERIKRFLKEKKVTRQQLADYLNVTNSTVTERLNSEKDVDSIDFILAVSKLTGVPFNSLIADEYDFLQTEENEFKEPELGYTGIFSTPQELEITSLKIKILQLTEELASARREHIIALKEKDRIKDEINELKKFLPVGGEAKLEKTK